MAIPGDTPRPDNLRSLAVLGSAEETSSILIKLAFDQAGQCCHCCFGLMPRGSQLDDRARCSSQHHQPHDRATGNLGAILAHPHVGVELARGLDKARGSPRVEAALVADRRQPARHSRSSFTHLRASLSSWEATLMYLRPAS